MVICGRFPFKDGDKILREARPNLLREIEEIIAGVGAQEHRTKRSKEKTMPGRVLYSPISLNKAYTGAFEARDWHKVRVPCKYTTQFYTGDYEGGTVRSGAFREMDFVKDKVGVEVQFGKYAFMVYNVCGKMSIFNKLGYIDYGVEIVPTKALADDMSTGVSYFEQLVWDLGTRGVADIDIPVLILGVE